LDVSFFEEARTGIQRLTFREQRADCIEGSARGGGVTLVQMVNDSFIEEAQCKRARSIGG